MSYLPPHLRHWHHSFLKKVIKTPSCANYPSPPSVHAHLSLLPALNPSSLITPINIWYSPVSFLHLVRFYLWCLLEESWKLGSGSSLSLASILLIQSTWGSFFSIWHCHTVHTAVWGFILYYPICACLPYSSLKIPYALSPSYCQKSLLIISPYLTGFVGSGLPKRNWVRGAASPFVCTSPALWVETIHQWAVKGSKTRSRVAS